jgi:acetolactate synthase I/II/III large subunit
MKVAEQVAGFLQAQGVRRLFGLCGGHIQPVWDAAARLGIEIVGVRHEMAATLMAQASAELTGEVGVATVTAGPGLTNALTGVANACAARTPLLVVSGVPPRPQQGLGALQEIPQAEVAGPLCRHACSVRHVEAVLPMLEAAWTAAREGGPAYIDFPTDLLREEAAGSARRLPDRLPVPPDPDQIRAANEVLHLARRPLVIAGRSAHLAAAELEGFLNRTGALLLETGESRGAIPGSHPSQVPAMRGRVMREADLVITVGLRLDFQLGYGSPAVFDAARAFIRIGLTDQDTHAGRTSHFEVRGEPRAAVAGLTATPHAIDAAWVAEVGAANRERVALLEKSLASAGDERPIHPYRLLGGLRRALPEGAVLVADGGDILSFARVALAPRLDPGPMGCLGVGIPYGIAAALATGRVAVVVTGDGALGLSAMEVETAVRTRAPLLIVVANNAAWNIERYDQLTNWQGRLVGSDLGECRYDQLARSLGAYGERVESAGQLAAALARALARLPALVDVRVDRGAISPDGRSGLAWVPDLQPLATWDRAEKALKASEGSP